jgi:MFS family permease
MVSCFVPDPKREMQETTLVNPGELATSSENEPSAWLMQAGQVGQACEATAQSETLTNHRLTMSERNLTRYVRAHFLYLFAWCGAGSYLGIYLRSLGATPLWITGVFTVGVLCEALVMTQVGRLSDRFGRRPLLAMAYVMMPIRLLLYVPATGPLWVMGVQTIHGLNFGILGVIAVAFINDLCEEKSRGAAQARLAAVSGLAAALGPAVAGLIAQRFGLPAVFATMSLVAAGGAVALLWKVRESLPGHDRLHRHGPDWLRPVLRIMCLPGAWLARLPRVGARRG